VAIAFVAAACAGSGDPEGAPPGNIDVPEAQTSPDPENTDNDGSAEPSSTASPESASPTTDGSDQSCPSPVMKQIGEYVAAQITTAEGKSALVICDRRSGDTSPVLIAEGEFQSNNVVVVPNDTGSTVVLSVATLSGPRVAVYELGPDIQPLFATLLSDGSDGETVGLVCDGTEGVSLRRIQLSGPGEPATARFSIEYADGRRESGELDLATQFPEAVEMITTDCGDMFPGRSRFADSLGREMLRVAGLDDVGGDHPTGPIADLSGNWNGQLYYFFFDLERSDLVFQLEIGFDWVGDCGPGRIGIRPSPPAELLASLSDAADCHEI
jgi:hypothetical protein